MGSKSSSKEKNAPCQRLQPNRSEGTEQSFCPTDVCELGWDPAPIISSLRLLLEHHKCDPALIDLLEKDIREYLTTRTEDTFIRRAKYLLLFPMSRYLRNPLPEPPDLIFEFTGKFGRWARQRLRNFSPTNTHLWYSWLQAKRAANPVSSDYILQCLLKHRRQMQTVDPLAGSSVLIDHVLDMLHFTLNYLGGQLAKHFEEGFSSSDILEYNASRGASLESTRKRGGQAGMWNRIIYKNTDNAELGELETSVDGKFYVDLILGGGDLARMSYQRVYHKGRYQNCLVEEREYHTEKDLFDNELRNRDAILFDKLAQNEEIRYHARIGTVLEPLKVRTVSAGPEDYFLIKPIQKALHGMLRDMPQFRLIGTPLCPTHLVDIALSTKNVPSKKWVSVDYSSATDNLSASLSRALMTAIFDRAKTYFSLTGNKSGVAALERAIIALAPHEVHYPRANCHVAFLRDSDGQTVAYNLETKGILKRHENVTYEYTKAQLGRNAKPDPVPREGWPDSTCLAPLSTHQAHLDSLPSLAERSAYLAEKNLQKFRLTYKVDSVTQTNGQLMGSIVSFPMLCLANYALYCLTVDCRPEEDWPEGFRRVDGVLTPPVMDYSVLANGDDMLYAGTDLDFENHSHIGRRVGLEMSPGKAYIHPVYANVNSTCLHYQLAGVRPVFQRCAIPRAIPYLPVGLFMGKHKVLAKAEATDTVCLEPFSTVMQLIIDGSLKGLDETGQARSAEMLKRYLARYSHEIAAECRGRNLFLPRSSGGLGVTPPPGWEYHVTKYQREIAGRLWVEMGDYARTEEYPSPGVTLKEPSPQRPSCFNTNDPLIEPVEPLKGTQKFSLNAHLGRAPTLSQLNREELVGALHESFLPRVWPSEDARQQINEFADYILREMGDQANPEALLVEAANCCSGLEDPLNE